MVSTIGAAQWRILCDSTENEVLPALEGCRHTIPTYITCGDYSRFWGADKDVMARCLNLPRKKLMLQFGKFLMGQAR
jgi:hypothetical protein